MSSSNCTCHNCSKHTARGNTFQLACVFLLSYYQNQKIWKNLFLNVCIATYSCHCILSLRFHCILLVATLILPTLSATHECQIWFGYSLESGNLMNIIDPGQTSIHVFTWTLRQMMTTSEGMFFHPPKIDSGQRTGSGPTWDNGTLHTGLALINTGYGALTSSSVNQRHPFVHLSEEHMLASSSLTPDMES